MIKSIAFAVLAAVSHQSLCGANEKPNILLILADDLGWSDLGSYGGEIQTPTLDSLAANGLRFRQFYNSARCCPTRASLLTGLYPHQAGVGAMSSDQGPANPGYRGTLQPHTTTLAEVLKTAGYHTSMVGKWHLHNAQGVKPTDRGFQEFYGMLGGYNSCWEEQPHYTRWPKDRPTRTYTSATGHTPGSFYATDVFADYALDFIQLAREAKQPFFQYLAFNAPHFPLHAPQAVIEKYEALYFKKGWDGIRQDRLAKLKRDGFLPQALPLPERSVVPAKSHAKPSPYAGKENPAWESLPEPRRRDLARRMAVYAAMVECMDAALGKITAELKTHGELDNTLIIFLSDNGACWEWDPYGFDGSSSPNNVLHENEALQKLGQPGDYCSYGSGWANACNTPWRLYKHYSHEGGIRTPCIVHWPKKVGKVGITDFPGHLIDVMPTLVELAGATYPQKRGESPVLPMEGQSLLTVFEKPGIHSDRAAPIYFEHEGSRALRDGLWKLVALDGESATPWELYDLSQDPNELQNLAAEQPKRVKDMAARWKAWAERCHVISQQKAAPLIAGKPLEIRCRIEFTPKQQNGVILAQGGNKNGLSLHLIEGKPSFSIRRNGLLTSITCPTVLPAGVHALQAKLKVDGGLELLVDEASVAVGKAGGLIEKQPQDPLSIGQDIQSPVGDYPDPFPFSGKVTDVQIR
jgi:arylsulfatase A-like enzyme